MIGEYGSDAIGGHFERARPESVRSGIVSYAPDEQIDDADTVAVRGREVEDLQDGLVELVSSSCNLDLSCLGSTPTLIPEGSNIGKSMNHITMMSLASVLQLKTSMK